MALESILRMCLAPDPTKRYQRAEHVAQDLDAFLNNEPLRHAPELSKVERVQKWLRRHPRLTSSGMVTGVAAALLAVVGMAYLGVTRNFEQTKDALDDTQAQQRERDFDAGTLKALCLVNTTTEGNVAAHGHQGIAACEDALGLYEVLTCDDWQDSDLWRRLPNPARAENVRELLLLFARGQVQQAPTDPAVLNQALALLDKAEAIRDLPPTPALWEDRADYLRKLGRAEEANTARGQAHALTPTTARIIACSPRRWSAEKVRRATRH